MTRTTSFVCGMLLPVLLATAQSDRGIIVTLAITIDGAKPGLLFNVVNSSDKAIHDDALNYNGNQIVVLTPGGYVVTRGTIADVFDRNKRALIPPGEQRSWEQPFEELLRLPEFAEAGRYRLYWQYWGVKSREIVLVRREPSKENPPYAPTYDRQEPPGTPRATFVAFLRSLDETAVHPGFALHGEPNDPAQVALSDVLARRAMRMGQLLHQVEIKKLPAGPVPPDWRIEATPHAVSAIEKASQTFSEYFGECTLDGKDFSVRLVRDRGRWIVRVADLVPLVDRATFDRTTEIITKMWSEVDDGKYATAAAVAAALRERLKAHPDGTIQLRAAPTTQPANKGRQLPQAQ